jgi:hypothetical protein
MWMQLYGMTHEAIWIDLTKLSLVQVYAKPVGNEQFGTLKLVIDGHERVLSFLTYAAAADMASSLLKQLTAIDPTKFTRDESSRSSSKKPESLERRLVARRQMQDGWPTTEVDFEKQTIASGEPERSEPRDALELWKEDAKYTQSRGPFMIDLPRPDYCIEGREDSWVHIRSCMTKEAAVEWIRSHVGVCDDEGNVNLITYCPDN